MNIKAKNSREKIEQGLRSHQHFYTPLSAQSRIEIFQKGKPLPIAYILSNLGQINQGENYGSWELIENHITASNRNYRPYVILHCTTFRTRLSISFSYAEPLICAQRAESMMDFFMSSIYEAIGEPSVTS